MPHQLTLGTRIDDLEITKVLSIGAFGKVHLARHTQTFKQYAIKSLPHTGLDHRQLAFQRNEIALHSYLSDHPHIIRLEKVVQTPEYTHAVLEYGSEGDLFSAITEKGLYYGNHELICSVFLQLIDAVRYSHQQHIYHRDLKPENVLVFDHGRTVKLADFGLATTDTISTDFGCGSTFYFSPECQGGLDGTKRIGYATAPNDVWALGIILINLSAGRNPWRLASLEDETFCGFLRDPNLLLKILPISIELNRILKRIFCLDPHRRITLDELYARIKRCAHFTRTPEVVRYETMMLMNKKKKTMMMKIQLPATNHDLPSPPHTPSTDNGSLCSTPSTQSTLIEPDVIGTGLLSDIQKKGANLDSHLRIVV
ncbi:kinase-like domain-containing protein [Blakeslea trispora]|nr:kinase-like domain-containing protein [Blakeslea trispora]